MMKKQLPTGASHGEVPVVLEDFVDIHQTLMLSECDRKVFFDVLENSPNTNERLVRALAEHRRRIIP